MFKAQVNDGIGPHAHTLATQLATVVIKSQNSSYKHASTSLTVSRWRTHYELQNSYATLLIGIRDLQSESRRDCISDSKSEL